jgi:polar amino acid transport system substrate-binding protein
MKVKISFFFLIVSILATFHVTIASDNQPLKLVNDPWPPYTGSNLHNGGVSTEIVQTALHKSGYKTTVDFLPWARAIEGTFDGTYDILITASYSEERAKKVIYSDPYLTNEIRFIKLSGTKHRFKVLEDLQGLVVGVARGYIYEPSFDKADFFIRDEGVDVVSNLKKLKNGRVDLIVEDELVARYYLNTIFEKDTMQVDFLPKALNKKNMHIIVRKARADHAEIISKFNNALDAMKKDGSYDKILIQHNIR